MKTAVNGVKPYFSVSRSFLLGIFAFLRFIYIRSRLLRLGHCMLYVSACTVHTPSIARAELLYRRCNRTASISFSSLITHRRSIAERGECFQRFLFVCQCVCLSVCEFIRTITSERLNVGRSNFAVRYAVPKSRPSSKVKGKGQRSRSPGTKNEKLLSHPH